MQKSWSIFNLKFAINLSAFGGLGFHQYKQEMQNVVFFIYHPLGGEKLDERQMFLIDIKEENNARLRI